MPHYYYERPFFTMEFQARKGASTFEHRSPRKRFFSCTELLSKHIYWHGLLKEQ